MPGHHDPIVSIEVVEDEIDPAEARKRDPTLDELRVIVLAAMKSSQVWDVIKADAVRATSAASPENEFATASLVSDLLSREFGDNHDICAKAPIALLLIAAASELGIAQVKSAILEEILGRNRI